MFTIQNKDLQSLDSELFNFNKEYSMFMKSLDRFPNLYAAEILRSKIHAFRKRLTSLKALNEFDSLVKENMQHSLGVQEAYVSFFLGSKKQNIDGFVSNVLGEKALVLLKKGISQIDYEDIWKYWRSHEEQSYKQIASDDEEMREKLRAVLNDLKKDVLAYGERKFNFKKDYEFTLALGQPYAKTSYFHPSANRMEIVPNNFTIIKESTGLVINSAYAIETFFHEVIGHARHEFNSRNMPSTVQYSSVNLGILTSHIHAEGVSQITRDAALDFMEENKAKYNLQDIFIEQRRLSVAAELCNIPIIYYLYLKMKHIENPKLNIEKEFIKVTGNRALFFNYSTGDEAPISFIKRATYPIGLMYMRSLLDDLKKEYGEAQFNIKRGLINEAIATGIWHFKVLPKFVRYFLKNKDKSKA